MVADKQANPTPVDQWQQADSWGMTPLHKAAQAGSVEQVQALLDRFAVRVRCVLQQDGGTLTFSASMGLQSMPRMCGKWAFPI